MHSDGQTPCKGLHAARVDERIDVAVEEGKVLQHPASRTLDDVARIWRLEQAHHGRMHSKAEELGVTQANLDEMTKSQTPAIQRLLGLSGDLGSRLGLDNKWLATAIKATGNYGEIYERNLGKASPLKLDRGLNGLWSKGGLMYALPFK